MTGSTHIHVYLGRSKTLRINKPESGIVHRRNYCSYLQSEQCPWALHVWYRMQGCVVHRGIKKGVQEPSWCKPKRKGEQANEPSCGFPWIHCGWTIFPMIMGYCSSIIRCEDNNIAFGHMRLNYYCVWLVEPCRQLVVARRSP